MDIRGRRGSTLIMTLLVFVVLMIFGTFILGFMVSENKMSLNHKYKTQAYYIARSGAVAVESALLKMEGDQVEKLNEGLDKASSIEIGDIDIKGQTASVELKKEDDKLLIVSKAQVQGIANTAIKVLGVESGGDGGIEIDPDVDVFSGSRIVISGNPNINGVIGTNLTKESGQVSIPENLKGNVRYEQNKIYPNVLFPETPDIQNKSKLDFISPISESISFDNLRIRSKLVVDTKNGDIDIVVKRLTINEDIEIKGSGKVRIFIEESLEILDSPHINKNGTANDLDIVINKGGLSISTNPKIYGNVLIKRASINITGNPHIKGSIFADVEKTLIYHQPINISGNLKGGGIIYCPNGLVRISGNADIDYQIIAEEIEISGNSKINFNNNGTIKFPPVEGGSSSISFKPGYFK